MTYASKTPEQQQNFHTLLNGMIEMYGDKRFDDHFDMADYQNWYGTTTFSATFTEHDCNTSACLLGHGPIFGIGSDINCNMGWDVYMRKFFGVGDRLDWGFLFSNRWPNDIQEAITRLTMYIEGFDPEFDDWDLSDRYSSNDN